MVSVAIMVLDMKIGRAVSHTVADNLRVVIEAIGSKKHQPREGFIINLGIVGRCLAELCIQIVFEIVSLFSDKRSMIQGRGGANSGKLK